MSSKLNFPFTWLASPHPLYRAEKEPRRWLSLFWEANSIIFLSLFYLSLSISLYTRSLTENNKKFSPFSSIKIEFRTNSSVSSSSFTAHFKKRRFSLCFLKKIFDLFWTTAKTDEEQKTRQERQSTMMIIFDSLFFAIANFRFFFFVQKFLKKFFSLFLSNICSRKTLPVLPWKSIRN